MTGDDIGMWGVPIAIIGGAIRVSTPFLFVSIGECLTERSGRINLGLEGTLVFGAMTGYAVACETGSVWLGVAAAAVAGTVFGLIHGWICSLPKVNDIAVGIALMLLGMGLAFFFGKPYIQPVAPDLPAISFGWWSDLPQVQAALKVNVLFILGAVLAVRLRPSDRASAPAAAPTEAANAEGTSSSARIAPPPALVPIPTESNVVRPLREAPAATPPPPEPPRKLRCC